MRTGVSLKDVKKKGISTKETHLKNPVALSSYNEYIKFIFSHFYYISINSATFTNKLKDETEYAKKMKSVYKCVDHFQNMKISELQNADHCHPIKADGSEGKQIIKVLEKYKDLYPDIEKYDGIANEEPEEEFFQLKSDGGIRLIGILEGRIFKLLFIDFYHQLYYDEKRNQGAKKYNYCMSAGNIGCDSILMKSDLLECEECLGCTVLEKMTL